MESTNYINPDDLSSARCTRTLRPQAFEFKKFVDSMVLLLFSYIHSSLIYKKIEYDILIRILRYKILSDEISEYSRIIKKLKFKW